MTTYHKREIASLVMRALQNLPLVVVTGLRQTGKTTFLQRDAAFRGRRYLSLDDFATLEAARREPESLLEGAEPLTIDEAQRSPELLKAVKIAVDRRRVPGRFLLSGSANLALLDSVSESLAGRALYVTLHPFTRRERKKQSKVPFVVRFLESPTLSRRVPAAPIDDKEILDGGMPSIVLGEAKDRGLWLLGYEQTYLERDVRELSQVTDLISFRNVVRLAALRTGQILNLSELAREAKLPASTVTRYVNLLETSFVITRLQPILRSRTTRLIKSPKLFLSDSGFACHLTGVFDLGARADEPMRGALFETYFLQNLAAILGAHLPKAEIGFWNVQGRHEVDFVVTHGRRSIAIEVKSGTRFSDRDLAGLQTFSAKTPGVAASILAYNGTEAVQLGERLFAIPIGLLLL
jgi:predicted AAA+ superfamily ATPase